MKHPVYCFKFSLKSVDTSEELCKKTKVGVYFLDTVHITACHCKEKQLDILEYKFNCIFSQLTC